MLLEFNIYEYVGLSYLNEDIYNSIELEEHANILLEANLEIRFLIETLKTEGYWIRTFYSKEINKRNKHRLEKRTFVSN